MNLILNKEKWMPGNIPEIKPLNASPAPANLMPYGSCFAINVYRWLAHYNLIQDDGMRGILYNPFSIMFEIKRLFNTVNWKDHILKEYDPLEKKYVYRDPWRTWRSFSSIDELEEFNANFDKVAYQKATKASAFLISYGLSEVWYSKKDPNIVFNNLPYNIISNFDDKLYRNDFATFTEVYNTIKETIKLIRDNVGDDIPVIFTVSPVPLKYTFSELPVRVANNLSKSVLLTAINEIRREEKHTYYFPSFEFIQGMSENAPHIWQADNRHVSAEVIAFIGNRFLKYLNFNPVNLINTSFWVPLVDKNGSVIGKLFEDGSVIYNSSDQ